MPNNRRPTAATSLLWLLAALAVPVAARSDELAVHLLTDHLSMRDDAFRGAVDDPNRFHDGTGIGVEWRLLGNYAIGAVLIDGDEFATRSGIPLYFRQTDIGVTGGYQYPLLSAYLKDYLRARGGALLAFHRTAVETNAGNSSRSFAPRYSPRVALNAGLLASVPAGNAVDTRLEFAADLRAEAPTIRPIFEPMGRLNVGWYSFNISFGVAFELGNPTAKPLSPVAPPVAPAPEQPTSDAPAPSAPADSTATTP